MHCKIDSVIAGGTTVTFTFDDGTVSTQTIANVPVDAVEATSFLCDYAVAYLAGKAIEAAAKGPTELVGQTVNVGG